MLIVRSALIAAICVALFSSPAICADSPPKPPTNKASRGANSAAPDKRGTDDVPLAVKILPAPGAYAKTKQEERDRIDKATADAKKSLLDEWLVKWTRNLFIATITLAFFAAVQVGLFWWQLGLIRDGAEHAKIAALAAKESADSVVRSERARMFLRVEITDRSHIPERGEMPTVRIAADNLGKTAASITKLSTYLIASDTAPSVVERFPDDDAIQDGFGVAANGWYHFGPKVVRLETFRPEDEWNLDVLWYCFGVVEYRDIFGEHRETGFCWQCRPRDGGGFTFSHRSTLNYQT